MKAQLFKVTDREHSSIHIQENIEQAVYGEWHYHPEIQISHILEGQGIAAIGDCISPFQGGDVFIIGSNIPHVFKPQVSTVKPDEKPRMVSLFFLEKTFGQTFFGLPELVPVKQFLQTTARGIQMKSSTSCCFGTAMKELKTMVGLPRLTRFFELLHWMANHSNKTYLNAQVFPATKHKETYYSKTRIMRYISENFHRPISLEEAARIAHLDKYAFCRYFKKLTHKSFVAYLNEFRVSMACKYLHGNRYSISQVGYLVGFNNLSYFNKQFKRFMNCTPSKYRDLYHKYFG